MRRGGKMMVRDKRGFTLIELMISLTIFSFCSMAIINMLVVSLYANNIADRITQATSLAISKIEKIKKLSTEEEEIGITFLGFDYLISSSGYLATMHDDGTYGDEQAEDGIFTSQDVIDIHKEDVGKDPLLITRTCTLEPFDNGSFAQPDSVNIVKLCVRTSWIDRIKSHAIRFETLIHRRRFVQ
ncbi:MAG: type IV pilus modification PilV family protein [bacterium]